MLAIDLEQQLQPGSFEHAIHMLISDHIDLSKFEAHYKNDENGRRAYDPALLLKIVLFAYSKGITSSREIEWQCNSNIIFKALSCDLTPHWTTIASFVPSFPEAVHSVFEQVLLICDQQGLLGHELLAIDGCKMSSNAAKEWSGKHSELKDKHTKLKHQIAHHLEEHKRKDELGLNDQVARHQQAIETLTNTADKIERFLANEKPRMGNGKIPNEVKSNITDNESAKMKTSKGAIQGYNGVATADKKHQVVVDATAFGEGQEHHTLQPVLEKIDDRYRRLGINKNIIGEAIVTADTGFANEPSMAYLHGNNINAYVPDNQFRKRDPKFIDKVIKHPSRIRQDRKLKPSNQILASEFVFDPVEKTCLCPAENLLSFRRGYVDEHGNLKMYFEGRLSGSPPEARSRD